MTLDTSHQFRVSLESAAVSFCLDALTDQQVDQLVKHHSMLREWNRRINLTRVIEPEPAARLHYAESLYGARFVGDASSLLDIGSGAGFPAVPLAVARPDLQVTALEANQKKSLFLKEVKDELHLDNLKVVTERLELFDWSLFDLLTSRALDRAEQILTPLIEQLGAHQRFMLYCGTDLLTTLQQSLSLPYSFEANPIPQSESRLIAIFAR